MYMDFSRGLISQGVSAMVSMFIAVYGFRRWGKRKPVEEQ